MFGNMKAWNGMEYALFRAGRGGLALMPYRWGERVLRGMAGSFVRWGGVRTGVVREQLRAVYPDRDPRDLESLTASVYDHLGRTAAEVLLRDPALLAASVEVRPGWEPLDEALAPGRGAIAATGHIGNFELGGRILARRYPVLDVVKPQRNPFFDRYLDRMRRRHGIRTVPVDGSGPAVLAHLRQGGLVTLLVDQDAGKAGLRTDFLGRPASSWPGAARLSLRTGCPVLAMAIVREDDGRHVLRLGRTLDPEDFRGGPEEVRRFTAAISAAVEEFILARPEQWFWVHRRWKGADEAG